MQALAMTPPCSWIISRYFHLPNLHVSITFVEAYYSRTFVASLSIYLQIPNLTFWFLMLMSGFHLVVWPLYIWFPKLYHSSNGRLCYLHPSPLEVVDVVTVCDFCDFSVINCCLFSLANLLDVWLLVHQWFHFFSTFPILLQCVILPIFSTSQLAFFSIDTSIFSKQLQSSQQKLNKKHLSNVTLFLIKLGGFGKKCATCSFV